MVNNSLLQKIQFALVVKLQCMFMVKLLECSSMNPKGNSTCRIFVKVTRFKCPKCHKTHVQQIPYECPNHSTTTDLYKQITYHLEQHNLSLKSIAQICGVDPHTVKAIDKDRLSKFYTTEDGSYRQTQETYQVFALSRPITN